MGALKEAARKGRGGDTRLGHLTNGDMIFPMEKIDETTRKQIEMFMRRKGVDPERFTVGKKNKRNPKTRLPEFAGDAPEGGTAGVGSGDPGGGGAPGGIGGDTSSSGSANPGGSSGPGDVAGGATPGGGDTAGAVGPGAVGGGAGGGANPGGNVGPGDIAGGVAPGAGDVAGPTSGAGPSGFGGEVGLGSATVSPGKDVRGYGERSAFSGNLGGFGQPDFGGVLNGIINGVVNDPAGTLGGLAIDSLLGLIPGFGQVVGIGNMLGSVLGKGTIGSNLVGGLKGLDQAQMGPATTGASAPGIGGGVGTDFSDYLTRRLPA